MVDPCLIGVKALEPYVPVGPDNGYSIEPPALLVDAPGVFLLRSLDILIGLVGYVVWPVVSVHQPQRSY